MKAREPAVAGMFYPAEESELRTEIKQFLGNAEVKLNQEQIKNLKAVISPHAGYKFSGKTMGYSFRAVLEHIKGSETEKFKVIILSPIHAFYHEGMCMLNTEYYETPLGRIKALQNNEIDKVADDKGEHSIEVLLPFLQEVFREAGKEFEILPVMVGPFRDDDIERFAEIIKKEISGNTLVVVSSDLSHYLPEEEAKRIDAESIKNIVSKRLSGFDACGQFPIRILNKIALEKGWKAELLDYSHSGEVMQSKEGVVGYAAIAYFQ